MIRTPSQRLSVVALVLVALALAPSAAAANEGSQIQDLFPLIQADGPAEVAVFAAVVDGEPCLWRTDGTAAGTFRVEPAGECVPLRTDFPFVGGDDGVAYFAAGLLPYRFWRTDGTAAGTWPLMDFSDAGLWNRRFDFIAAPSLGAVLFVADDGVHGREMWVSDGSPESAQLLADLTPGPDGTVAFRFRVVGAEVFFFVVRGGFESELWKTDGTAAGTVLVESVGSEEFYIGPLSAYPVEDRLVFFLGGVSACLVELWTSDGTAAGTQPIRSFTGTGCPSGGTFQATGVAGFPDRIIFAPDDGVHGAELWSTDGTPSGTFALTDFGPPQPFPAGFPLSSRPVGLGGEIFFEADDGVHGRELWRSDGTPGGSSLVVDLRPGASSGDPGPLSIVGDHLVFSAETPAFGRELWVSDGTAAGTQRATDLCPGACGASIFREVVFGDSLLFIADDGTSGQEWWIFTLPAGPAVRLTDLASPSPFGTFLNMTPLDGRAVFTADDGVHGREPWVTDGTPGGTHLLADLQGEVAEPQPPAAPSDLTIENLGGGQIRLRWQDNSDDEEAFYVEIELLPGSPNAHVVPADTTSYTLQLAPGSYRFRIRAYKLFAVSEPSNEVEAVIGPSGNCTPDEEVLCLGGGRFRVRVHWRNQHAAPGAVDAGHGRAVPAGPNVDDSGYFWFFTPDNLELVVKVLDGTPVNGHYWVFWGALSDVEYSIDVEDTVTGAVRSYHNPPGQICGGADTAAFPELGTGDAAATSSSARPVTGTSAPAPPFAVASGPATRFVALDAPASTTAPLHPPQPCVPDAETLCLLDGMLAVTLDWTDQHNGGSGVGQAVPYTDITGFFWFFHPENIELVVKALDGRTVNGKIWVFYGALSDVGYTIRVENRADGHAVRTYTNPPGTICGNGDTAAF